MSHNTHSHVSHMNESCHTYESRITCESVMSHHTHRAARMKSPTITHYNTLQHTATHCNTPQHAATHCNCRAARMKSPTITHCNTPQHAATYCNCRAARMKTDYSRWDQRRLQTRMNALFSKGRSTGCMVPLPLFLLCVTRWERVAACCGVLQCVAVCCSVLRCVAVCCGVLQCVAVCCSVL